MINLNESDEFKREATKARLLAAKKMMRLDLLIITLSLSFMGLVGYLIYKDSSTIILNILLGSFMQNVIWFTTNYMMNYSEYKWLLRYLDIITLNEVWSKKEALFIKNASQKAPG